MIELVIHDWQVAPPKHHQPLAPVGRTQPAEIPPAIWQGETMTLMPPPDRFRLYGPHNAIAIKAESTKGAQLMLLYLLRAALATAHHS